MSAKANKRKSLIAQNGPPSKSPKVKSNNTPIKQVQATHPKGIAQGKGQGAKGKKVVTPAPRESGSENEDEDDSDFDFEFDDEFGGDSENDSEGVENEQDSDDEAENEESDDDEAWNEERDDDEDGKDDDINDDEDESTDEDQDSDKKTGNLTTKKSNKQDKQKRYVVYVGNIPFTSTEENIRDHFKSVGPISHVRIITHKGGKPKGFCFVEFKDSQTYEKSLSLNNTFLGDRRITVEYSANSKDEKKVKEAKKKNFKLQALQKQGKLQGGLTESQKRRNRRLKAKQDTTQENNSD